LDALGLIEVRGLAAAYLAGDAACKAAHVTIEAIDSTNPPRSGWTIPLVVLVKIRGNVSSVQSAVEAAKRAALTVSEEVNIHVIPMADQGLNKIIAKNKIKKSSE
jgi:microcompartment protein CcmL/EutN